MQFVILFFGKNKGKTNAVTIGQWILIPSQYFNKANSTDFFSRFL